MSAFWQVATREFTARKMVLWTGVAIALLALAAPFFPWDRGHSPADVRAFVTVFLGVALAAGSALMVGASLVGPDLAERRLAFYFSRPISAAALWWGKVAGGFAIVLLSASVSMLPNLLPGKSSLLTAWGTEFAADAAMIALLLFFLFVAAATSSVAFRSHSLWLAVDVAAIVVTGLLLWITFRNMVFFAARGTIVAGAWVMAGALLGGLLAGGWALATSGRTEPARAHRALSLTVWSFVLAAALGLGGWSSWATAFGPSDIRKIWPVASADGHWVVLSGSVAGRGESFSGAVLLEPSTGRFHRLPVTASRTLTCSADSRRAAWFEWDTFGVYSATLVSLDLSRPDARPASHPIVLSHYKLYRAMALSPDGSRVALLAGGTLSVSDLETGRIVASVRVPEGLRSDNLVYDSAERIVLFPSVICGDDPGSRNFPKGSAPEVHRFDIGRKKLEIAGTIDAGLKGTTFLRRSPDGRRYLLVESSSGALLVDGDSFRPICRLLPDQGQPRFGGRVLFLADGRIALSNRSEGETALSVFSQDGRLLQTVPLGKGKSAQLGAELAPGTLTVVLGPTSPEVDPGSAERLLAVDLSRGTITEIAQKTYLTLGPWSPGTLDHANQPVPGSLGARLFRNVSGELQLLDPASGKLAPFPGAGR